MDSASLAAPGDFVVPFCLLFLERICYGYCYHRPAQFKQMLNRTPVAFKDGLCKGIHWKMLEMMSHGFKVLQLLVIGYDFFSKVSFSSIDPAFFVVGLLLAVFGQVLNVAVYYRLGAIGVYYGAQLGYDVPWCTEWPFAAMGPIPAINHPQYFGVALTILGCYLGFAPTLCPAHRWWVIPVVESACYGASCYRLEHGEPFKEW
eukprot:gnl/TRDRNA2_/TRDRNA2_191260_c0_seq1.p1 gnl/TRDRNA2_/TRDRNA2_191260_c0~~gnl/TRDRNA2_/TRDRNA2_191260_c0_seq1.p1  ORF type:complete len:203 (-),score=16.38 gnl/TRDRNA2_/TRDRNA2_191260_c0_seq1:137-745(-)